MIPPLHRPALVPSGFATSRSLPEAVLRRITARRLNRAEQAIAVTDYMLTLKTALFAASAVRQPTALTRLHSWPAVFVGSIWAASPASGAVHGFVPRSKRMGNETLRTAISMAPGATPLTTCVVGSKIAGSAPTARLATRITTVAAVAYLIVALSVTRPVFVAVAAHVPTTSILLGALVLGYWHTSDRMMLAPAAGAAPTFVAAGVQIGRVTLHARLFAHNALYQLIQAGACALGFIGVGRLLDDADRRPRPRLVGLPWMEP